MNTIDYFSQPDELYRPVYCTLHVVLSPKNFGISRALVRLSGHSRETLAAVFQDPPKSLRIELRRLKRLRRYLNGCGCFYQVSFDLPSTKAMPAPLAATTALRCCLCGVNYRWTGIDNRDQTRYHWRVWL